MPLLLVLRVAPSLTSLRTRVLLALAGVVAVVMTVAVPCRLMLTEWRGRRDVLNAPFAKFASDLQRLAGESENVVTDNYWLAGNLVLRFPQKQVFSLDISAPSGSATNCVLIWDARKGDQLPHSSSDFAKHFSPDNA